MWQVRDSGVRVAAGATIVYNSGIAAASIHLINIGAVIGTDSDGITCGTIVAAII